MLSRHLIILQEDASRAQTAAFVTRGMEQDSRDGENGACIGHLAYGWGTEAEGALACVGVMARKVYCGMLQSWAYAGCNGSLICRLACMRHDHA